MAIEITHVRFGGGKRTEEEIVRYRWKDLGDGQVGDSDKPELVAWVDRGNSAHVGNGNSRVKVGVVRPTYGQPYLRTYADRTWTNNLVNLPTF